MTRAAMVSTILPETVMAEVANSSLDMKPMRPGIPIMLREPMVKATPAMRFRCAAPVKFANFLLSPETASKREAARNSRGLVRAWVMMWKMAATVPSSVPKPRPI